jgi:hypothetical protein
MYLTEGSETLAKLNLTLGKYPKENIKKKKYRFTHMKKCLAGGYDRHIDFWNSITRFPVVW